MPALEAFFHYRNLDVSTLKELAKRWKPDILAGFKKAQAHTALADIHESIDELAVLPRALPDQVTAFLRGKPDRVESELGCASVASLAFIRY